MLLFPQRPVATLKAFAASKPPACALSLSLSAHIPYSAHSFFITSPLLSWLLFFLPSLPLPLLSDLSFSLVQRLHNAHQLFRGSLPVSLLHPIRAGLCTNGLLLYLLPAPTHSQDSGGEGGKMGGREIDRGSRRDSPGGGRMTRGDRARVSGGEMENAGYSSASHLCEVLLLMRSA